MSDMFPNHPRSGPWETLKGGMLAPYECETMTSTSEGDSRHQAETTSPSWDSTTIEMTGTTTGSGLYDSSLENH